MFDFAPIILFLVFLVSIIFILVWLGQIIGLIQRDEKDFQSISEKWMWFIVVIVLGPIGGLLYCFAGPKEKEPV